MRSKIVVFTDLDGTLLDHNSYSFEDAVPALELTRSLGIPVVICSSKTRAEIEYFRRKLDNREPFISENGGGVFIPKAYFNFDFNYSRETNEYKVVELGTRYETLVEVLNEIRRKTGLHIKGFSDMSVPEIARKCGLSKEIAELAKMREYDEPFTVCEDERASYLVKEEIKRMGFKYTEGGRFFHLTGDNDKGKAVRILAKLFQSSFPELKTVGIGDSLNDLHMLESVDIPILVKKPDGKYDHRVKLDNLILAGEEGPRGWNRAILNLLQKGET
ncbi:MAG: mannosyl-3-phosphoglycerate phosphatase [Deltaproteobacteria bacterium]|nr:MAG: mannosyl-3-phosphoglycerate phosphatase [Deltaproteobacteria bacterium]